MAIKFGISPISWSNDDLPEMGGETSLETCLRESRLAGYSGTETGGKFPMDAAVLGPRLAAHELQLVSGWFSGGLVANDLETEKRRVAEQLRTYLELGAPLMVFGETTGTVQNQQLIPVSQRPTLSEDGIKQYGEKLTAFAEFMSSEGMPIAFHHHMGTVIETEHEVDLLMAHTGSDVGLLLDTGHLTFAGGDSVSLLKKHGDRVSHVHMKDVRADIMAQARINNMSFLDAVLAGVFTVPGDGMIDYQAVADELARQQYSGWVIVEAEQDPVKAPPLEYARMGLEHLRSVFTMARFDIEGQ
ncbi:MAG: myo-inosose-2 dehydratase [Motiliproteus sp.]